MEIRTGKRFGNRTALIVYSREEEKDVLEMMLILSELRYEVTTKCAGSSQATGRPILNGT